MKPERHLHENLPITLKNGQTLMESILIIDDEPFIRENVQRVLSEDGYRVLEAANGAQARELVASDEVDLALLD